MRINLNQLHVFYLAARHGSMAGAAKRLYVSPPAVTMQIKKLEGWLGFPVFDRVQGALSLTAPGRKLFAALEPLYGNVDELERYIHDMMRGEEMELSIGAHHIPGNYFVPDLIASVRARFQKLRVRMEIGTQDRLLENIARQRLDLAVIVGEAPPDDMIETTHLFDEELALVTDAKSDLGGLDFISVHELGSIPLILQQRGGGALRSVLEFLERYGVKPDVLLDNLSSDVIKQFLPKARSAAFIGRFIVRPELESGALHEIKIREGTPVYRFYLAYLRSRYMPAKIRNFISCSSGFVPKFHAGGAGA